MLKTSKTLTIHGQSFIDDVQAAYMTANVSEQNVNITKNITNQTLYEANKESVRKDMEDFDSLVYSIEDEGAAK